jgi:toxin ParE1/3/4
MSRFRLAQPAQSDLATILATSAERWGADGRRRYALILAAAMRKAAAEPEGPLTRPRPDLHSGLRSLHVRHARRDVADANVRSAVHVLYFRIVQPDLIEIVRVLHERMEPSRHLPD